MVFQILLWHCFGRSLPTAHCFCFLVDPMASHTLVSVNSLDFNQFFMKKFTFRRASNRMKCVREAVDRVMENEIYGNRAVWKMCGEARWMRVLRTRKECKTFYDYSFSIIISCFSSSLFLIRLVPGSGRVYFSIFIMKWWRNTSNIIINGNAFFICMCVRAQNCDVPETIPGDRNAAEGEE